MKRKTFLNRMLKAGSGIVILPSLTLFTNCDYTPIVRTKLSQKDIPFLDEIGETIIPSTGGTPGAKATKIGEYIMIMVQDCYNLQKQNVFLDGLNTIDAMSAMQFKNSFLNLNNNQKKDLLKQIQLEAIAYKLNQNITTDSLPHYFDLLKDLTISGYFSSEIGKTKARNYIPVPGRFEGCIPYDKFERPWS